MSVKLIVLKTGENIIADIKEALLDDKLVCYVLDKPCTATIAGTYKIIDDEKDSTDKVSVIFQQWPLLSKDTTIELTPDSVVTMTDPQDDIKKMYQNRVMENKNETN